MKLRKIVFASALLAAFGCVYAADNAKQTRKRVDAPWVSLAHQRALSGGSVEKSSAEVTKKNKKSILDGFFTEDSAPELSADKFNYAQGDKNMLIASGNAQIVDKQFEIFAENISYAQNTGEANASGNVAASDEKSRIVTSKFYMNQSKGESLSEYTRFGISPIFAETDSFEYKNSQILLKNTNLYVGEPSVFSMGASAETIKYNKETDILELEDTYLNIGPFPVFYVPYYSQHGLGQPPFSVDVRAGYNSDNGLYLANTILYNGLGALRPGVLFDYYSKRSVLFGPAASYDYEGAETWAKGFAQFGFINDNANALVRGVDSFGNKIGKDRYFFDFNHVQTITENISVLANVNWWSDEFVTRDFRPDSFYENQLPDNFAEVDYYGDSYTLSLFTRFAPNSWERVPQRLPEARFDLSVGEIANTGIYQDMYASAGYLKNTGPSALVADYVDTARFDAYYGLLRPFKLSSWSTFTPVVGARLTHYSNARNGSSTYTRALGQVGFDAQMDIWGTWEYQSRTMGIDGLRHHITPIISYRYIPNAEQGSSRIPIVDDFDVDDYTYPPILDLGEIRNTDRIFKTNVLRLGLENVLETRDETYGSREIARFDVFQDFNFEERPLAQNHLEESSFSDLYTNFSLSPARWLKLGVYNRFNVERLDVPETNTYITLLDADKFSITLITSYLKGEITQYAALAEYRISEIYKLRGLWNYDYKLSEFTDQSYGLLMRLGNSWVIEYRISYRNGSTRQNNFSCGLRLSAALF